MNTGYRLDIYKDVNPYSSTYGNTKTEKIEDIIMCPYISGEVIFKVNIGTDNFLLNKAISKTSSLIISIDWGDGSIIEEIGNGITDISHTYSIAGDYTISVTMLSQPSTVDIDLSNRTTDILKYSTLGKSLNNVFTDNYPLITKLNPVFTLPNITTVSQPFTYCSNLVRVEDGTFDGIFSNTDSLFGLFYVCENLEYIPTDILKDFKGSNINSIFYRCNKLSKNINDLLKFRS